MSGENEYKGFREIVLDDDAMADFYQRLSENVFECLINEYLIIKNNVGEIVDYYRWGGESFIRVSHRQINNDFTGKIKARNPQQTLAIDMLLNTDITVKALSGNYGSGKTYLMVSAALDLIKRNKFERLIWVRNNINVSNTAPIGALPGDLFSKMLPYAGPLSDHIGGISGITYLCEQNKLSIDYLGFMRGRDIKNSIVMVSEAENLTKEHAQLLVSRISDGSTLFLDGDVKQVDMKVFEDNNGLLAAVNVLKGHPLFGYIKLQKSERSATAALADLFG